MANADALQALANDLTEIFGARLQALVSHMHRESQSHGLTGTLALVERLSADDLRACAERAAHWHRRRLATPLVLNANEFRQALDAFPFEFGAIISDHTIIAGRDPFAGVAVDPADLRRACEVQARSHLLHLREGFIESGNRTEAIATLIERSAAPLAALLRNLTRLGGQWPIAAVLTRVAQLEGRNLDHHDAPELFTEYLDAVEALTAAVDRWTPA